MAYEGDDYKEAKNILMKLGEENSKKSFRIIKPMNFKLGNFQKQLIG
jgi:hypothetical protein